MTTCFNSDCDLIVPDADEIVQPLPQLAESVGVNVTEALRLMASLLAKLRLANNSKLALFARWLWISD